MPRLDVPDKVAGRPPVHPRPPPGRDAASAACCGRRRAAPSCCRSTSSAARAVPGVVAVVRDGSFLGVVAEREENALRALAALRAAAVWQEHDSLPDERDLARLPGLRAHRGDGARRDARRGPVRRARSVRARFTRPYLAHASIAPSCGLARLGRRPAAVWSHSQGVTSCGRRSAGSQGLATEDVVVQHVEGAGCYGHNAADDAAYDAVLLARAVPGPARSRWSGRARTS